MTRPIHIDILSDTHNQHKKFKCEGGDILLHTGDLTLRGTDLEILQAIYWIADQPYKYKCIIPGNHDWDIERDFPYWKDTCDKNGIHLLNDSGVRIWGIEIWGSASTPWFHNWAFNRHRGEDIAKYWSLIPDDTEILLTHGPPMGVLDEVFQVNGDSYNPSRNVGCEDLLTKIKTLPKLKLHAFGHIHSSAGVKYEDEIMFVNGSCLDEMYQPSIEGPLRISREILPDNSILYLQR